MKIRLCLNLGEEIQFLGLMNDGTGEDEAEVRAVAAGDTASLRPRSQCSGSRGRDSKTGAEVGPGADNWEHLIN